MRRYCSAARVALGVCLVGLAGCGGLAPPIFYDSGFDDPSFGDASLDDPSLDTQRAAPEPAHNVKPLAGGSAPPESVLARRHMVVAAHPLATRAGLDILRQGGSALDAALAVQLVLNLVEPQSSGIGGGAFLLHYDAATDTLGGYDGRETAPAALEPDVFLTHEGEARSFYDAAIGGLSVGVPGVLRLLEQAHGRHGRLPWSTLFAPAIDLAETGFYVTPRLHGLLAKDPFLRDDPAARALYYTREGEAVAVGTRLRNPDFAATLRVIARAGADAFYTGALAESIVRAVRTAWRNPGVLSRPDMATYRSRMRPPVCRPYRRWHVCGFPPPTSGGVTLLQALTILEAVDPGAQPVSRSSLAPDYVHWLAEAGRLAYADRDRYLADSDFVDVPVAGLLDRDYLRSRAATLKAGQSVGRAAPGTPPGAPPGPRRDAPSPEHPSTSHFVVVDDAGNAVSMTSSIESGFGSRLMVGGFLLNNQLTDFSFHPESEGQEVANRVAPGKRPRSSMSPVMVFDAEGRLVFLTGSPGGSRIITYVFEHLVRVLDFGLDPQTAMNLPHTGSRNGPTELEEGRGLSDLATALADLGHDVRLVPMTSGLHSIGILPDKTLVGGADPRREGVAMGD